ncbi:MAG TPA: hypothetical protein VFV39_10780 [Limnobacter sp.]|nr:hypothetical protein [Limnobacter sp.]
MTGLSEQEILKALASWVHQQKSPYTSKTKAHSGLVLPSRLPDAWLEFRTVGENGIEVNSIHTLLTIHDQEDLPKIRLELDQFNKLMERVKLPVFVWEDRKRGHFQLRWQEVMYTPLETALVQRFFEQALYLANALQSRLGWAVKSLPKPLAH